MTDKILQQKTEYENQIRTLTIELEHVKEESERSVNQLKKEQERLTNELLKNKIEIFRKINGDPKTTD